MRFISVCLSLALCTLGASASQPHFATDDDEQIAVPTPFESPPLAGLQPNEPLPPGTSRSTLRDSGDGLYDSFGRLRSAREKIKGNGRGETHLLRTSNPIEFAEQILGLDVVLHSGDAHLSGNSSLDDKLYFIELATFTDIDYWDLDPANPNAFGNCVYAGMYTNDWSQGNFDRYYGAGGAWTTLPNPTLNNGRGMDISFHFQDPLVFETDYADRIHIFEVPGAPGTSVDVSAFVPNQMSGLTTFPLGNSIGVAVTVYTSDQVYIFSYHGGSDLRYEESATLPWSEYIGSSLGIAYDNVSGGGTFFWAFTSSVNDHTYIAEFEYDLFSIFNDSFESGDTSRWSAAVGK